MDDSSSQLLLRVEAALTVLAWCIEQDGDVHLPLYEKFEVECAALRNAESVRDRALRRLNDYREARTGPEAARALPYLA